MKQSLLLILIIALSGCVSKKATVKERIETDTTEQTNVTDKVVATDSVKTETEKTVTSTVKDNTVTDIVEIEYSRPDSLGAPQYILREIKTQKRSDVSVYNEENERIISEQKSEIKGLRTLVTNLRTQLYEKIDNKIVTKTKPPLWSYILAMILGALVALIIRQWLRKLKL